MNFKGHLTGGMIAGGITSGVALWSNYVRPNQESIQLFLEDPLYLQGEVQTLIALFITTLFMSLFPDLDTASIPQRWFFRGMFLTLTFLFFTEQMEIFSILAFVSLLPVMHKHRGWTHWKITPWLIILFLIIVFEYFRFRSSLLSQLSVKHIIALMEEFWMYVFACVLGHYTHLLLDSQHIKILPFVSNNSSHH